MTEPLASVYCALRLAAWALAASAVLKATEIDSTAMAEPPLLAAVTVKLLVGLTSVGVPLMAPVVALSVRPLGSAGTTDQPVTGPWTVGVSDADCPAVREALPE